MASTEFTNELGNKIRASVVDAKKERGVDMVNIAIAGPSSTSENIVTKLEARKLARLLNAHLGIGNKIVGERD